MGAWSIGVERGTIDGQGGEMACPGTIGGKNLQLAAGDQVTLSLTVTEGESKALPEVVRTK